MEPLVLTTRHEMQEWVLQNTARREGKSSSLSLGFVPTMGALHKGHVSLLQRSVAENQRTVLSIFVNPRQFGPNEDYAKYPRTFKNDLLIAQQAGVDVVFAPTVRELYPQTFQTMVSLPQLSNRLCGLARPGHFDGVATVVLLLLNIVMPSRAYFGMKDFQQLAIVQALCRDMALPLSIVPVPTVRESDGLAMSSRNAYLTDDGRGLAAGIPYALGHAAQIYLQGERGCQQILDSARKILDSRGLNPQYLELVDAQTLQPYGDNLEDDRLGCLAVAQPIQSQQGSTRLIDNIILGMEEFYKDLLNDLVAKVTSATTLLS